MASSKEAGAGAPGAPKPMVKARDSGVVAGMKVPLMIPVAPSSIHNCPLKFLTAPLAQMEPSGLVIVAVVKVKVASHSPRT